jgi:2-oxo-4-hydroxy-4-carboxy-5-ureidoimidazoline decarboxylase
MPRGNRKVNQILGRWNEASRAEAVREIMACCGATAWAERVARRRPFFDEASLLAASDEVWLSLPAADRLEAFRSHPRIGESSAQAPLTAQSASWSRREQGKVTASDEEAKTALAAGNRAYEQRFGHIFIVCATGKSAAEILAILHHRMQNDVVTELREAAEQQRQITQLRLKKWLGI